MSNNAEDLSRAIDSSLAVLRVQIGKLMDLTGYCEARRNRCRAIFREHLLDTLRSRGRSKNLPALAQTLPQIVDESPARTKPMTMTIGSLTGK